MDGSESLGILESASTNSHVKLYREKMPMPFARKWFPLEGPAASNLPEFLTLPHNPIFLIFCTKSVQD